MIKPNQRKNQHVHVIKYAMLLDTGLIEHLHRRDVVYMSADDVQHSGVENNKLTCLCVYVWFVVVLHTFARRCTEKKAKKHFPTELKNKKRTCHAFERYTLEAISGDFICVWN